MKRFYSWPQKNDLLQTYRKRSNAEKTILFNSKGTYDFRLRDYPDYYLDQAICPACFPSASSSTALEQKASRSSGLRLVVRPSSTTTS